MPGIDPLRFNQLLDQLDLEQFQAHNEHLLLSVENTLL
jgi:hypothetical protein